MKTTRIFFFALLICCFVVPAAFYSSARAESPDAAQARAAFKKLNWELSVAAYSFRNFTFFETVDKIAALGIDKVEGFSFQRVSGDIPGTLAPASLSDEQLKSIKEKLSSAGVQLVALYYGSFPNDETACRRIFSRSRDLGVRWFISEPAPGVLPLLDRLGAEYGIAVGLHGHDKNSSPNTWHPELVLKQCAPYSKAIGAFSDTGHWQRSELDPAEGARILKDRLVGTEIHDLHAFNHSGHDVPLGEGVGNMKKFLSEIANGCHGTILISVEYVSHPENPAPDVQKCVDFIKSTAIELANNPRR